MTDLIKKAADERIVNEGEELPIPVLEPTGNPMLDMAQRAMAMGDVSMVKELLAMRDDEDRRNARQEFNKAFASAQSEFPIVPKRGRGHNGIQYARVEDIIQAIGPVLARHGLSVRHQSDTTNGVVVTATLAHISGHSEQDVFVAEADKSGSKNSVQAIKSTITYARRTTLENLLGLASHGEDDDAFASGDTPIMSEWRERIGNAETVPALDDLRAELFSSTDVSAQERTKIGHVWTAKRKTFPNEAA